MSKIKRFKNKNRRLGRKQELFAISVVFSLCCSALFIYTYLLNSPFNLSELPKINIVCENEITAEDYIECTVEVRSENPEENILPVISKIKVRGDFNANRPKKGYRIELSESKSLLGLRNDDDWILFALYFDITCLRVKLALDLWHNLEETNPKAILPDSRYISLYINDEFKGLYLLAEKNDRRLYDLDNPQNNIYSSLIIQAKGFTYLDEYIARTWEQDWPNEDDGIYIMDEIMIALISFINNSNDNEFFDIENGIYSKFFKLSLIDFYLFNFFIYHQDIWDNNYFIIRNTYPNQFYLISWDFDYTFGQNLDEKCSPDLSQEEDIRIKNVLYDRLLGNNDFLEDCKNRWLYIRSNIWTEDFILDMLYDNYDLIKDVLHSDVILTYSDIFGNKIEEKLEDSLNHLFKWIPRRLDFCDQYFSDKAKFESCENL